MQIKIKTNAEDVSKAVKSAGGRQVKFALKNTVNDLAFQAKRGHKQYVNQVFDRPTRWTENATEVLKASPKAGSMRYLAAWVQLKETAFKGVGAVQYLKAQAKGGTRADKRSEKALRAKGILPPGYQTLVMPKYQNRYGNISGPLMVKILSYLRVFGEQGYNMNRNLSAAQRKTALKNMKRMHDNPDKYFVLYSKKQKRNIGIFERKAGRNANGLPNAEPILMFIRTPRYVKRYDLPSYVEKTVRRDWYRVWKLNYARALATMKIKTKPPE